MVWATDADTSSVVESRPMAKALRAGNIANLPLGQI
jgi:hypothetical protein